MKIEKINELTEKVIGLAIKVHRTLGPGFLESVYQAALAFELSKSGICFEKEKDMPVQYENIKLDVGFRCDFIIENKLIVECKAVKELSKIDEAQLINYLKISGIKVGLLINFNVIMLKNGIKRMVYNLDE